MFGWLVGSSIRSLVSPWTDAGIAKSSFALLLSLTVTDELLA
jgi:hypothetical protein